MVLDAGCWCTHCIRWIQIVYANSHLNTNIIKFRIWWQRRHPGTQPIFLVSHHVTWAHASSFDALYITLYCGYVARRHKYTGQTPSNRAHIDPVLQTFHILFSQFFVSRPVWHHRMKFKIYLVMFIGKCLTHTHSDSYCSTPTHTHRTAWVPCWTWNWTKTNCIRPSRTGLVWSSHSVVFSGNADVPDWLFVPMWLAFDDDAFTLVHDLFYTKLIVRLNHTHTHTDSALWLLAVIWQDTEEKKLDHIHFMAALAVEFMCVAFLSFRIRM